MFLLAFLFQITAFMPSADSLSHADSMNRVVENVEYLYQLFVEQAENQNELESTEGEVLEADYEELLLAYEYYLEHPININTEDIVKLEEMGLLGVFQVEAIRKYRRQYGDLLFMDELLMLEDFSEATVAVISPLVYFGKSEKTQEREQITFARMLTRGKHQVTLNYAEKFGDIDEDDYLGSPRKIQLKYSYRYKQRFRVGFAMEKDAGEPFFYNSLTDSISDIVNHYRKPGFDFYGAYGYVSDIELLKVGEETSGQALILKDLALGDYQLSFGQGLTLWSGMSLGKASGGSSVMKRGTGVRPKTSAGEGKFFRGAATTLKYRDFYATAYYSLKNLDATVSLSDSLDKPVLISAIQESGYHRTMNELEKRHSIRQQVFGGHLCYAGSHLEVGFTAYHLRLEAPLDLKPTKYNQYYFQGDRLTNMGLDFRWLMNSFVFFGELSRSDNGGMAGLVGMTAKPMGYVNFSLLFRNYGKGYQNLLNGAFGESSRGQGEEGVYLGLQCTPTPRWELLAYCDFFRLTWLSSQVYNPSWGEEYSLKINHQINNTASLQIQFKSKTKMKNSTDDHVYSHYPVFYTKRTAKLQFSYGVTEAFSFSDKAAYSHYFNGDGSDSKGYMLCHDVHYKPPNRPFSLTVRYALFSCDDYNSRISMYENDVLGAFSIPSLSGTGQRAYVLGKLKLFGCLSLYSRVGLTVISGETKTDLKVEVVWKG